MNDNKANRMFNALAATWHEVGMPEHDPTIKQQQYANSEKMIPLREKRDEIESECPGIEFDDKHPRHKEYHKILSAIKELEDDNMRIGHPDGDPERNAVYDRHYRLEEIAEKVVALQNRLEELISTPDTSETAVIKKALADLSKEKAALMGKSSGSTKGTEAQKRQVELIEKVRELMQGEIESRAWPTDKQGKEGLLRFVWRRHKPAIKHAYGCVEYDTVRRKTTPEDCKKLGLEPLPK